MVEPRARSVVRHRGFGRVVVGLLLFSCVNVSEGATEAAPAAEAIAPVEVRHWSCKTAANDYACSCDTLHDNGQAKACGTSFSCCMKLETAGDGAFCECRHASDSDCDRLIERLPGWTRAAQCPR